MFHPAIHTLLIALVAITLSATGAAQELPKNPEPIPEEFTPLVRIPEDARSAPPPAPVVRKRFVRQSSDSALKCSATEDDIAAEGVRWLESLRSSFNQTIANTEPAKGSIELSLTAPDSKTTEIQRSILISPEKTFIFKLQAHPFSVATHDSDLLFLIAELLCYEYATRQTTPLQDISELPPIPFWLVDGLAQQLNSTTHSALRKVVFGCARRNATPSFSTLSGWSDPLPDPLYRVWQRAFTFWAVRQLTYSRPERQALAEWLRGLLPSPQARPPAPFWENNAAAEAWWKTSLERGTELPSQQRFDSEFTRSELTSILASHLHLPDKNQPPRAIPVSEKKSPVEENPKAPFPFDQLLSAKQDALFFLEMRRKDTALQLLLARSDWLYAPLVARYLEAVRILLERSRHKEFPAAIAAIASLEHAIETQRESVRNIVDWWEINYGTPQHDRWEVPPFQAPEPLPSTKNAIPLSQ